MLNRLYLHHLDIVNDEFIEGWCFNRLIPSQSVRISCYLDDNLIGKCIAGLPRKDVFNAGLHPNGHAGFHIRFPAPLADHSGHLTVKAGFPGTVITRQPVSQLESVVKDRKPAVFMHIPKTAGTTLNNHIRPWFGADHWITHIESIERERLISLKRPGQYLAGHLPLYKLIDVFGDLSQLNLYTILREPYAHLHSHLSWIKGIGNNPEGKFFNQHPDVVKELALTLQQQKLNSATQIERFVEQLSGFQCDFFDNLQTRYFLGSRPDLVSENHVAEAKENLPLFRVVGLTEKYDKFYDAISKDFSRRPLVRTDHHNPSKVNALFDQTEDRIRSALYPLVRHDMAIYQHVLRHTE